MNISSAAAGYAHSAVVQPKPAQARPVRDGDRDGRAAVAADTQQQSALQAAAKGSVNLLV